ncbi:hypothetical protein ATANTOWER_011890 [Ataeniobius toweri]|uniref:Uncharacterized protein n=1 Tax=Ataeniobius toweri TaxID=208326 RepID=A0ABU7B1T1_9TELE|nr:hypothetical protein [Ataeniobius toweri]
MSNVFILSQFLEDLLECFGSSSCCRDHFCFSFNCFTDGPTFPQTPSGRFYDGDGLFRVTYFSQTFMSKGFHPCTPPMKVKFKQSHSDTTEMLFHIRSSKSLL